LTMVDKNQSENDPALSQAAKDYESKATDYLRDPDRLRGLLDKAQEKAKKDMRLPAVWGDLVAMCRLIRAYVQGKYRRVPWPTIVTVTAAIVYFVTPIDVIPDFLAGLGLLDDAVILGWTIKCAKASLDEFRHWESEQETV